MVSLDSLGIKYNTDKASKFTYNNQEYKGHDYLRQYEIFLKDLKRKDFTLIELGCFRGSSLRMWKEYFPKVNVIGVDLNQNLAGALQAENIGYICSDATAEDLPEKILNLCKPDSIMCILDDCSHAWGDQRRSFEMLFPLVKSGGYYIIEDLECGSMGAYPEPKPKVLDAQVFFDYALDRMRILRVSENRNQEYFRPFFKELPAHIQKIEKSIDMSIIIPGAIIFRKK